MAHDTTALRRYSPSHARESARDGAEASRPAARLDVKLFGAGNSGEAVALRCQALGFNDGVFFPAAGLNNDRLPPRAIAVRRPDGGVAPLDLAERLVMDDENPRELIREVPLLERRYARLLRGISVFETYPRAGDGGHGHPAISTLDIDLNIDAVLGLLRRALRDPNDDASQLAGRSGLQQVVLQRQRQQAPARDRRIVIIGGGCGAMGNAAHHLLPYLVRWLLAEQGIASYQLWGVVLGPRAFTGLTPFVRHNYRALLDAIEHMAQHGQRRTYLNDLTIDIQRPPYDRVFLLDDPTLPGEGARVTEAEMEAFLDRAALSLYLLLRGDVWQTVASRTANDDGVLRADGRLRYLHTVHGVAIGADRARLADALTVGLSARVLDQFIERFS